MDPKPHPTPRGSQRQIPRGSTGPTRVGRKVPSPYALPPPVCPVCGCQFRNPAALVLHMREKHDL